MSQSIQFDTDTDKAERYQQLIPQIEALVSGENNFIANCSNVMAALKEAFDFLWIGCYFVDDEELVLGPFQGPVACTRIAKGKGVCGTSWANREIILVPDVDAFEGHIACSSDSRSEIVLPIIGRNEEVVGVLDVDSEKLENFDLIDLEQLGKIADLLGRIYNHEA